jgi:hypothetical protein
MKGNPPMAGGSLTSKPTWSNAFEVFHHVGFFFAQRMIVTMSPESRAPRKALQATAEFSEARAIFLRAMLPRPECVGRTATVRRRRLRHSG